MAKTICINENCIITSDDKGQRTLVGKAKEALTTMDKNKVEVYILLSSTPKDEAEKFLKENNVPYKELLTKDDEKKDFDCEVVNGHKTVVLKEDWRWALDDIAHKLYGKHADQKQPTEQEKMDKSFKEYQKWAKESKGVICG